MTILALISVALTILSFILVVLVDPETEAGVELAIVFEVLAGIAALALGVATIVSLQ